MVFLFRMCFYMVEGIIIRSRKNSLELEKRVKLARIGIEFGWGTPGSRNIKSSMLYFLCRSNKSEHV